MNTKPQNDCHVCALIPSLNPALTIIESAYWLINLRFNDQTFLGHTIITAKRHVPEIDYLTKEEYIEFNSLLNRTIRSIRTSFNPITFNVSCLKNDAFKDDPDNTPNDATHVHWHVIPRYTSKPVIINNEEFNDPYPGQYISGLKGIKPREKTLQEIAAIIRRNF